MFITIIWAKSETGISFCCADSTKKVTKLILHRVKRLNRKNEPIQVTCAETGEGSVCLGVGSALPHASCDIIAQYIAIYI